MTTAQAYREYLRTQGQARLMDMPESFPFLVHKLDEELPDVQDVQIIRVAGRTPTTWCMFRVPGQEWWYSTVILDWCNAETFRKEVVISRRKPDKVNNWFWSEMDWHEKPLDTVTVQ